MLGFVIGAVTGLAYIGLGMEPEGVSVLAMYLAPVGILAVVWLVGLLFTKTLGIASMFAMIGAVIGGVLVPFHGAAILAPALLLHALTYLLCQHGLRTRLDAYGEMGAQRHGGGRPAGRFVSRYDLGGDAYADFYVRPDGTLIYRQSPALEAAQPPLELFYSMQVQKEYKRLQDEMAAARGATAAE